MVMMMMMMICSPPAAQLPQLLRLTRRGSADGLSLASALLHLYSISGPLVYCLARDFPLRWASHQCHATSPNHGGRSIGNPYKGLVQLVVGTYFHVNFTWIMNVWNVWFKMCVNAIDLDARFGTCMHYCGGLKFKHCIGIQGLKEVTCLLPKNLVTYPDLNPTSMSQLNPCSMGTVHMQPNQK